MFVRSMLFSEQIIPAHLQINISQFDLQIHRNNPLKKWFFQFFLFSWFYLKGIVIVVFCTPTVLSVIRSSFYYDNPINSQRRQRTYVRISLRLRSSFSFSFFLILFERNCICSFLHPYRPVSYPVIFLLW